MRKLQKENDVARPQYMAPYGVPQKRNQLPSILGGFCFVTAVAAFTFVGTSSVVNALNRNALNQIASIQTGQQVVDRVVDGVSTGNDSTKTELSSQLEWAQTYGITWDEHGNPIDKNGNVMNDPTTEVNEVARAIANGAANADGVSLDWLKQTAPEQVPEQPVAEPVIPEAPKPLYDGIANVSKTADGTYIYTVQSGDSLNRIAKMLGVPVDTLISLNGFSNPNFLRVGQQLVLPSDGITQNASGAGLG